MSRMERVKAALASTITKLRGEIETSHKMGRVPQDYSLGFANGLIFADHHINLRDGSPKFYERTTSIGALPKPVVLHSGNAILDEQTYQFLQDEMILKARNFAQQAKVEGKIVELTSDSILALVEFQAALEKMDKFVTEQVEFQQAAQAEISGSLDAGTESHEGSNPSAAEAHIEAGFNGA